MILVALLALLALPAQAAMLATDAELLDLPADANDPGWKALVDNANEVADTWCSRDPAATEFDFYDIGSDHDVCTLAKALVAQRLLAANPSDSAGVALRNEVRSRIMALTQIDPPDPNADNTLLAANRNLAAYILAADTIRLSAAYPVGDPNAQAALMSFIDSSDPNSILNMTMPDGRAGIFTMDLSSREDPTNWGGMARASTLAAYIYQADSEKAAVIEHAHTHWMGGRRSMRPSTIALVHHGAGQTTMGGRGTTRPVVLSILESHPMARRAECPIATWGATFRRNPDATRLMGVPRRFPQTATTSSALPTTIGRACRVRC
jgi:hypothetical protein